MRWVRVTDHLGLLGAASPLIGGKLRNVLLELDQPCNLHTCYLSYCPAAKTARRVARSFSLSPSPQAPLALPLPPASGSRGAYQAKDVHSSELIPIRETRRRSAALVGGSARVRITRDADGPSARI
mmetsp:Transcript_19129/g.51471  ORF Transcript_19129/g.51471 Transcript_19129/m.51471 type:complete len:126 (-) Transcript_19129:32-409(-)